MDFRKAFDKVDHKLLWEKIRKYGAGGNFLNIIKSMYEKVKSCVWSKDGLTNFFNHNRGARQGCLLSPLLFSLYINDLVECLENGGAHGISLWDIRLCAMLYADDLILLAESESDLKLQMEIPGKYTIKWNMEIIPKKSEVMIFNNPKKRKDEEFFCVINNILTTKSYKYLGVILNAKHSYKAHADMIVEKVNNCLFSLIKKSREWRGFNPYLLLHLFDHLISTIMSYGCEIWRNHSWDKIEKLHLFICKYALGVKSSMPNDGVYAELGRYPLSIFWKIQIVKFANRIWSLDEKKLVKKALNIQMMDDVKGHYNWVSEVIKVTRENNISNTEMSNLEVSKKLKNNYMNDLYRIKSCKEGKKLRTYALFKRHKI